jgi:ZIP family zinc transporter
LSRIKTFLITLLSGLTEPAAAAVVLVLLQDVERSTLAFSSAFAAGAMVYITVDELIPEVYRHGEGHAAVTGVTFSVLAALLLMSII